MFLKSKYGCIDYSIDKEIIINDISNVINLEKLINKFVACCASRDINLRNK